MKLSYSKKIQFLVIDVCSYKLLRSVNINFLVIHIMQTKGTFNDQLVKCISSYYQILMYLHTLIGKMPQIVPLDSINTWYDFLYELIYQGYNSYLYESVKVALHSLKKHSIITLFDRFDCSSVKYTNFIYDSEKVFSERNLIYNPKLNRLNAKFRCHPFYQIIRNIR